MATVRELVTMLGYKINQQQLSQAEASMNRMGSKIKGSVGGAMNQASTQASGFFTAMKWGAAGIVGSILAIGKKSLDAAADMETLNAKFEVMLGSSEKASTMVTDLRKFAASTPFALKDLSEGAVTLLNFGLKGEQVIPTLRMLGDVAGDSNDKFRALALVFGQIQSTGKLMGGDLLQLINAGFNPLQVISKKTGQSVASLKDAMSKGAISADMVTEAFKIATSEGGLFFKNMEKQSQTLNGMISTMKDAFKDLLVSIGQPMIPLAKELVGTVTELVQGTLGQIIQVLVSTLIPIIQLLSTLLKPLLNAVLPVVDEFSTIFIQLFNLVGKLLAPAIQLLFPILQFLGIILGYIGDTIYRLTPVFDMLGEVIQALIPAIEPILSALIDIIDSVFEVVSPLIDIFILLLRLVLVPLIPILKIIGQLFGFIMRFIVLLIKPVAEFIQQLANLAAVFFESMKPLFDFFALILTKIAENLGTLNPALGWLGTLFGWLGNILNWVIGIVSTTIKAFQYLAKKILSFKDDILDFLGFGKKKVNEQVWSGAASDLKSAAKEFGLGTKSFKQTNISMKNKIGVTALKPIDSKAGAQSAVTEAAKSIFSLELQKLLINTGY